MVVAGYAADFRPRCGARPENVTLERSTVGARIALVPSGSESIDLALDLEVVIPRMEHMRANERSKLAHQIRGYSRAPKKCTEFSVSETED